MSCTNPLALALTLIGLSCLLAQAVSSRACNPLTTTCPPSPGLASKPNFIDFTQQSTLPANWTLANYETITYGPNGAEFRFSKRHDAPSISTDFYILFGHVEVVMKAAPGVGIISSVVLMSDDADEIDLEFSGNNFGAAGGKIQTNYFGKGMIGDYDRGTQPMVENPQTEFHTYTLDWSSTSLMWSVDGAAIRTLPNSNANSGPYQYPQTPAKLQIGLWDAGDVDRPNGTVLWAGGYTDLSKAPFTMFVKSVKITNASPCSGGYQYTDTSGSCQSIKCVETNFSSGSNATLAGTLMSSSQTGSAASSTLPASSSTSSAGSSSAMVPNSSKQSSAVVEPIPTETSSSIIAAAVPLLTTSTLTLTSSNTIATSSSAQYPTQPAFTGMPATTVCANNPENSTAQPLDSSPINPTSVMPQSSPQSPPCHTSPANFTSSAGSGISSNSSSTSSHASASDSSSTSLHVPSTTSLNSASTTTSLITVSPSARLASAGTRLLPWPRWMSFFR